MDGHIDGLPVHGQLLLVGSGVAAGDRLVGHPATLVAGRLAGRQWTGLRGGGGYRRWISATTFGGQLRAAR
jgi:hypothetical protein